MEENTYILTYVAGYDDKKWRIRMFPKTEDKNLIEEYIRSEVRGPFRRSRKLNPELDQRGIAAYVNADSKILNLKPAMTFKGSKGEDVTVEGNVVLAREDSEGTRGLTVEEAAEIIKDFYPELGKVDAVLCYEEVAGQIDKSKTVADVTKETM